MRVDSCGKSRSFAIANKGEKKAVEDIVLRRWPPLGGTAALAAVAVLTSQSWINFLRCAVFPPPASLLQQSVQYTQIECAQNHQINGCHQPPSRTRPKIYETNLASNPDKSKSARNSYRKSKLANSSSDYSFQQLLFFFSYSKPSRSYIRSFQTQLGQCWRSWDCRISRQAPATTATTTAVCRKVLCLAKQASEKKIIAVLKVRTTWKLHKIANGRKIPIKFTNHRQVE